jgi:hypothetical protein
MNDRSRGPGRSQESDLQRYPLHGSLRDGLPLGLRDRLVWSAVNTYSKLLSALAFVVNFVVIARVPVGAVAERVTHTVSAPRRTTRRDRVTAERVGK